MPVTKTTILDEAAVSEIEAQLTRLSERGEPWESTTEKVDTFRNVASCHALSLCATVKHLRERERTIAAVNADWLEERQQTIDLAESLQSKIGQLRAENERLRESLAAEVAKRVDANVEQMEQSQKVSQSEIRRTFDDRLPDTQRGSYE